MDENELKRFYAVDYHRLYQDQEEPSSADLIVQQRRAEHFAELLYSLLGECTSHLDIGCSSGRLLVAVAQRLNIRLSIGIEPSDAYRTYCTNRGLRVYGSLDELQDTSLV